MIYEKFTLQTEINDLILCIFYVLVGCSHSISHDYFIESISSNNFIATNCPQYILYSRGACDKNNKTIMGENVNLSARGNFYLDVNKFPPYAISGKRSKIKTKT